MKNLYLLPTEKPSRLIWYTTGRYHLLKEPIFIDAPLKPSRHIYITSDEEIKEGDVVKIPCGVGKVKELSWKYGNDNPSYIVEDIFIYKLRYGQKEGELQINSFRYEDVKKITLTTDQDLIKDGVQAIDDEFLEWFVKNPSCEFVMTIPDVIGLRDVFQPTGKDLYKIIIPKEESTFYTKKCKCMIFEPNCFTGMCKNCGGILKEETKLKTMLESLQEYFKNTPKEKVLEDWNEFQHLDNEGITVNEFLENQKQTDEKGRPLTYWGGLEERKQETLEEAAMNYLDRTYNLSYERTTWQKLHEKTFIAGAKWQQEQIKNMYSEEEVRKMFSKYNEVIAHRDIEEWQPWIDKQFKKK